MTTRVQRGPEWTPQIVRAVERLCATFVPALAPDPSPEQGSGTEVARLPAGAMSAAGAADAVEALVASCLGTETQESVAAFAATLHLLGFCEADLAMRTAMLIAVADSAAEPRRVLRLLRTLTMLVAYAVPEQRPEPPPEPRPQRRPGPPGEPRSAGPRATGGAVTRAAPPATITVEVCVVGSGAGGSVVAAALAAEGVEVAVLEAGEHCVDPGSRRHDVPGYQRLWLDGALAPPPDGGLTVLSGATVGGSSAMNHLVWSPPSDEVRAEWARLGLAGVAGPDFDIDLAAVTGRATVVTDRSAPLAAGKLGLAASALRLRVQPLPRFAGVPAAQLFCDYCPHGCRRGAEAAPATGWLLDAVRDGSALLPRSHADRITVRDGRATGVDATVTDLDGSTRPLRVNATTVVVAAGAVHGPALLQRSGIGGPAAGRNLWVQPIYTVTGVYDDPVGTAADRLLSAGDRRAVRVVSPHGFPVESPGIVAAFGAASLPWADGPQHSRLVSELPFMAAFRATTRSPTAGRVRIDEAGRPVVDWMPVAVDVAMAAAAHRDLAQLHEAAGARAIVTTHERALRWDRGGEPLDGFLARLAGAGYAPHDLLAQSAHHQGSCRMGRDPATSVADVEGRLHDVANVWVGDASAFPSAAGPDPILTTMALAHRTARRILGDD